MKILKSVAALAFALFALNAMAANDNHSAASICKFRHNICFKIKP